MSPARAIVLAPLCLVLVGCSSLAPGPAQEPVACSLDPAALEERKVMLAQLTRGVTDRKNIERGIAYRFDAADGVIGRLARLVELESDCCQFLTFRIIAEAHQGPIWLEIVGSVEAQPLIREYFDPR